MQDPRLDSMIEEMIKDATTSLMTIMEDSYEGEIKPEMLSEAYIAGYRFAVEQELKRVRKELK